MGKLHFNYMKFIRGKKMFISAFHAANFMKIV